MLPIQIWFDLYNASRDMCKRFALSYLCSGSMPTKITNHMIDPVPAKQLWIIFLTISDESKNNFSMAICISRVRYHFHVIVSQLAGRITYQAIDCDVIYWIYTEQVRQQCDVWWSSFSVVIDRFIISCKKWNTACTLMKKYLSPRVL